MSVGMLIPERGEGDNNSRWVYVHYLMGGTLKNLTLQAISGSMYKSMYIGHNVQEKVIRSKGKMSISTACYSMKNLFTVCKGVVNFDINT